MKSVSQNLTRLTHKIVARRVEDTLQPGNILALIEDQTNKIVSKAINDAFQQELSEALGRDFHERGEDPQYRNGYKKVRVLGQRGWLSLRKPVLRGVTPPSSLLASLRNTGKNLVNLLASRF